MAVICPYNNRKCSECEHHRKDEDYGDYACFVKKDLFDKRRSNTSKNIKTGDDNNG